MRRPAVIAGLLLALPVHAGPAAAGAGGLADYYRREGAGFSPSQPIPAARPGTGAASPGVFPGAVPAGTGGTGGLGGVPGALDVPGAAGLGTQSGAGPGSGPGTGSGGAAGPVPQPGPLVDRPSPDGEAGTLAAGNTTGSSARLMGAFSGAEVMVPAVPAAVPEPAALAVLGAGLLGLLAARRRAG